MSTPVPEPKNLSNLSKQELEELSDILYQNDAYVNTYLHDHGYEDASRKDLEGAYFQQFGEEHPSVTGREQETPHAEESQDERENELEHNTSHQTHIPHAGHQITPGAQTKQGLQQQTTTPHYPQSEQVRPQQPTSNFLDENVPIKQSQENSMEQEIEKLREKTVQEIKESQKGQSVPKKKLFQQGRSAESQILKNIIQKKGPQNVGSNLPTQLAKQGLNKLGNELTNKAVDKLGELAEKGFERFTSEGAQQMAEGVLQNTAESAFESFGENYGAGAAADFASDATADFLGDAAGELPELATQGLTEFAAEGTAQLAAETGAEAFVLGTEQAANVAPGLGVLIAAATKAAIEAFKKLNRKYHIIQKLKKHPEFLLFLAPGWIVVIWAWFVIFMILSVAAMGIFFLAEFISPVVTPDQAAQLEAEFQAGLHGAQNIPCFTINVDGPDHVANPTPPPPSNNPQNTPPPPPDVTYTVTMSYCGADDIEITNPIPDNLAYLTASGNPNTSSGTPTWELNTLQPTSVDTSTNTRYYTLTIQFSLLQSAANQVLTEIVYANDKTLNSQGQPVPGLTLIKSASPSAVQYGDKITYTISAIYTGTDDTLTIFDKIPDNTTLSGTPTGNYTNTNGLLSWVWKDNKPPNGNTQTFSYVVQPTQDNVAITNTVYATAQGQAGNIVWLNYTSHTEFDPHYTDNNYGWIGSQCSQASMAEIFNSYLPMTNGVPYYKIVTLEEWGYANGVWDPYLGLMYHGGITKEAEHYGFKVVFDKNFAGDAGTSAMSTDLDQVISLAKSGHPMMVSSTGHWFVIWGEDAGGVWALDSSAHNYTYSGNPSNNYPSGNVSPQPYKIPRSKLLDPNSDFPWTGWAVEIIPQ